MHDQKIIPNLFLNLLIHSINKPNNFSEEKDIGFLRTLLQYCLVVLRERPSGFINYWLGEESHWKQTGKLLPCFHTREQPSDFNVSALQDLLVNVFVETLKYLCEHINRIYILSQSLHNFSSLFLALCDNQNLLQNVMALFRQLLGFVG